MDVDRLTLGAETHPLLERHARPGNVRELRNVMERAAILADDGMIGTRQLPPYFFFYLETT